MSINWTNLRSLNRSQFSAFEELCCQLAACEQMPSGAIFKRKGAPDAGVECFWTLPNGDEWGWQAKFFLSVPDGGQWQQIDDSVKTALEKHPRLTSYTVCLPIDRTDPRTDNRRSFMDRWDEHVCKWKQWAQDRGMSVEFSYWGEHEIWERLSHEEHRGRFFFWFNEEQLSEKWFEEHLDEVTANAGPRYSPELNVNLTIAHLFDGLGRTKEFFDRVKKLYGEIKRAYRRAQSKKATEVATGEFSNLTENLNQLMPILETLDSFETDQIQFNAIADLSVKAREASWECIDVLDKVAEKEKSKAGNSKKKEPERSDEQFSSSHPKEFNFEKRYLDKLIEELDALKFLAQSNYATLANQPALLIAGDAGTGKTHLLCDIATNRIHNDLPTVLLLGEQFNQEDPWLQIIKQLRLSCQNRNEFLGALDAAAQVRYSKALILIDALNEGEGKILWKNHLAGMLAVLRRYPRLAVAISVRTSYEQIVIPDRLMPDQLIREEHRGFAQHEYEATRTFFDFFGIERPSVPLLVPEFQNPLFLKIFCEGIKNYGLTRMPTGIQGVTAIFNFFVKSVNRKLHHPAILDFDEKQGIVQKAVQKIAELMAEKNCTWLHREEAQTVVDALIPRQGYEESLFRHLISEGLLAEDMFYTGRSSGERIEAIRFPYERFTDHLIAQHLLNQYLDLENPAESFAENQPLSTLLENESKVWQNRGIIEAFCIQLPERVSKELVEVAPHCSDFQSVKEAFTASLIWRNPQAVTDATLEYINGYVIIDEDDHHRFLDALLTLASNPHHLYNADFLHKSLINKGLSERDTCWSIFLHYQYGEHGAVDRIVDWAWSADDKSHIHDEPIRLCSIALAWFFTTSHRFLRDRATKALVSLLTDRIHILRDIIPNFLKVNDPYVLERLFAVAYGCVMRSDDNKTIGELAQDVYQWIFKDGIPPPHILLRDYARGVIEVALHRGIAINIEPDKIRPPYQSEWASFEIPTEEELKKYNEWQEDMPDIDWARVHLYNSVMGSEDFARYIIGTNFGHFGWTSQPLGAPKRPTRKQKYENFIERLSETQREKWKEVEAARETTRSKILEAIMDANESSTEFTADVQDEKNDDKLERELLSLLVDEQNTPNDQDEENGAAVGGPKEEFLSMLDDEQRTIYQEVVIPYLSSPSEEENRFDLSLIQRWIFQKVLDLGWSLERFGQFDRDLKRYSYDGRTAHKPERIGKKYQWIAYHELLARVSDNFEFKGGPWDDHLNRYLGSWQVSHCRDIDPSCLLKKTEREGGWEVHTNSWWFPIPYDAWGSEPDDVKWLKSTNDLPTVESLIEVINPEEDSKWLMLEARYHWEQATPVDEERYQIPRRSIVYTLKSYIVKRSDMGELFKWAQTQDFWGDWMPKSYELSDVFLGEFFWSPAFNYYHEGWTRGMDDKIPKQTLVSTDGYMQEGGDYDCSIADAIHISLPARWLADKMGLTWNGVEGHFYDGIGKLIAFDPTVKNPGPGALLINQSTFQKFLADNGYDILWILTGEKRIIGGRDISHDNWQGTLELNGAYRIHQNQVCGVINSRFRSRNDE